MESEKLFRYIDNRRYEDYSEAKELVLESFTIDKETNKGYWIVIYGKRKFVLKGNDGKRFAYNTKQDALSNFIKRKTRQILLNKIAIKIAKHSLSIADKMINQE